MNDEREHGGLVKSDVTLFRIIDALRTPGGTGVTELAAELDLAKSAVHKHLKTLTEYGYVTREDGEYTLSYKFLTLGGELRDNNRLCKLAQPKLLELAEATDEMVLFSILEHDHGVFVFRINEKYGIGETLNLGNRFELHQNSAGKAILAQLPDEEVRRIIDERGLVAQTENTITDEEELYDTLEVVREKNYAINLEERKAGLNAVGTAIYDEQTGTHAAVSIAGAASRLTPDMLEDEILTNMLTVTNELELQLRYR